nr:hypothetical protein [Nanoarchaeota archaeon]
MTVELEEYDIINPEEVIKASALLNTYDAKIKGINTRLEIREVDSFWIALSKDFPGKILGYLDHRFTGYMFSSSPIRFLHDVSPDFINPGLLIVNPEYIGNRIGTILNEQRKERARSLEQIALIMPRRPGDDLSQEERDRRFPYSTEQLRNYYLRHGFREFNEAEAKRCVFWLDAYKDRICAMIDEMISPPEDPPYPEPVFGDTRKEKILEQLSQTPRIRSLPPIRRALRKRRSKEQWERWWEERDRNRLLANGNYRYVMIHLLYNGADIDITKISHFSSHSRRNISSEQ